MAKTPSRPLTGAAKAAADRKAAAASPPAQAPTKVTPVRRAPRVNDDSMAAGAPTRPSVAATPPSGFYDTEDAQSVAGDYQRAERRQDQALYDEAAEGSGDGGFAHGAHGGRTPDNSTVTQGMEAVTSGQAVLPRATSNESYSSQAVDFDDGSHSADASLTPQFAAPDPDQDPEAYWAAVRRIQAHRSPLGTFQQKLALPVRRGYHRHWFNDQPGRVDQAMADGWSFVRGRDGKSISRNVGKGGSGTGGALRAYAMEIPTPVWEADQATFSAMAQGKMDGLKRSPAMSNPSHPAQSSDANKFYSPAEGDPIDIKKVG